MMKWHVTSPWSTKQFTLNLWSGDLCDISEEFLLEAVLDLGPGPYLSDPVHWRHHSLEMVVVVIMNNSD